MASGRALARARDNSSRNSHTCRRELVEEFAGEIEAGQALEAVAQAKRRRGYRDL